MTTAIQPAITVRFFFYTENVGYILLDITVFLCANLAYTNFASQPSEPAPVAVPPKMSSGFNRPMTLNYLMEEGERIRNMKIANRIKELLGMFLHIAYNDNSNTFYNI